MEQQEREQFIDVYKSISDEWNRLAFIANMLIKLDGHDLNDSDTLGLGLNLENIYTKLIGIQDKIGKMCDLKPTTEDWKR